MAESREEWVEEWVEERRKECVKLTVSALPEWKVNCNTCDTLLAVGSVIFRDCLGEEFCGGCFEKEHESSGYEALIQKERADEDNWGESQI